jgi:hypothetical protein
MADADGYQNLNCGWKLEDEQLAMSWRSFSPITSLILRAGPLIPPIGPCLSTSKMLLILVSFILDVLADSGYGYNGGVALGYHNTSCPEGTLFGGTSYQANRCPEGQFMAPKGSAYCCPNGKCFNGPLDWIARWTVTCSSRRL